MTNQNETRKDAKTQTAPERDALRNAAELSEIERELTDAELVAIVGGTGVVLPRKH